MQKATSHEKEKERKRNSAPYEKCRIVELKIVYHYDLKKVSSRNFITMKENSYFYCPCEKNIAAFRFA